MVNITLFQNKCKHKQKQIKVFANFQKFLLCFHFLLVKKGISMYSILYSNFRKLCFRDHKGV